MIHNDSENDLKINIFLAAGESDADLDADVDTDVVFKDPAQVKFLENFLLKQTIFDQCRALSQGGAQSSRY